MAPAAAAPASTPNLGERRTILSTFGIGPTFFASTPTSGVSSTNRFGVVLQYGARFPIEDNLGIGLRLAWGLTEFHRMETVARPGYHIGRWTTGAYESVWNWAGEGPDSSRVLRWMGAFFSFVFLVVPYAVAAVFYIVAPVAPTTYLETDLTFNYDFGSDRAGQGAYMKAGLGLVGYVHPRSDRLLGGLGPTGGFGYRIGRLDLGCNVTYLPPSLHGENPNEQTNVVLGGVTVGINRF